jgi:hypothetical protein
MRRKPRRSRSTRSLRILLNLISVCFVCFVVFLSHENMKNTTFEIVTESSATRCEICHKADRFDPITETCLRCQALVVVGLLSDSAVAQYRQQQAARTAPTGSIEPQRINNLTVSLRDFLGLMREALKLYHRNWLLLTAIYGLLEIPLIIGFSLVELHQGPFSNWQLRFWYGYFILLPILLTSISIGALIHAIVNRYHDKPTSLLSAYRYIWQLGPNYLFTSILGSIFQWSGLLLFSFYFSSIVTDLNKAIAFIALLLLGLYAYPRFAFVSEVAVTERKYFIAAFRHSANFGVANWLILCTFALLVWLVPKLIAVILLNGLSIFVSGLPEFVYKMIGIGIDILSYPFVFTTKVLLYFHLSMRNDNSRPR